jgi:hypothetical protein
MLAALYVRVFIEKWVFARVNVFDFSTVFMKKKSGQAHFSVRIISILQHSISWQATHSPATAIPSSPVACVPRSTPNLLIIDVPMFP